MSKENKHTDAAAAFSDEFLFNYAKRMSDEQLTDFIKRSGHLKAHERELKIAFEELESRKQK